MADYDIYQLENLKKLYKHFSEYNYPKESFLYYKQLKKFLEENNLKESDPELYKQYQNYLTGLKFLGLTSLEWNEVKDLLKNHFKEMFKIDYYQLWNKIEIKLLQIPDFEERDKKKKEIKDVLFESSNKIINKQKYNKEDLPETVSGWLKDYISNVGLGKVDKVKKAEYLTSNNKTQSLDEEDKNKVRTLINLYDSLNYSSEKDPEGLEEPIIFNYNGKSYLVNRGEAEDLSKYEKMLNDVMDTGKDEESEPEPKEDLSHLSEAASAGQEIVEDPEKDKQQKTEELEELKSKYPDNSLEQRAIEEEIKKLDQDNG